MRRAPAVVRRLARHRLALFRRHALMDLADRVLNLRDGKLTEDLEAMAGS